MDLCVGVTVGSAIQIACFVLPGCVLIGMCVDRSLTLFMGGLRNVLPLFRCRRSGSDLARRDNQLASGYVLDWHLYYVGSRILVPRRRRSVN